MVDGFDIHASHNVSNSLTWGPDGWLYGCNGILSNSLLGRPGTADADRVKINCGVWRYHPTRQVVEAVAHGTTNPWGLDFDDYGQMFITNCVIAHLWHVIPGAHYQRMFGQDYNPHTYELMASCADHLHWGGGHWTEARGGAKHHAAGGGHAHSGAMVYLGDNWPDSYRNHVFTCNIHGHRLNQDSLERQGSGYVAHHGEDMMLVDDSWFRGLVVTYGPDGGVYVADWTDTGECHNYKVVDQTNGRIYKITSGQVRPWQGDLASQSDQQLVALQLHPNDWLVRHARRLLQERHAAGKLDAATRPASAGDPRRQCRPHAPIARPVGAARDGRTERAANCRNCLPVRANIFGPGPSIWSWKTARPRPTCSAGWPPWPKASRRLGSDWPWPRACSDCRSADRWTIATALAQHSEDAGDANLPLMLWYGVEPLVPADAKRGLELALASGFRWSASSSPAGPARTRPDSPWSSTPWAEPVIRRIQVPLLDGARDGVARAPACCDARSLECDLPQTVAELRPGGAPRGDGAGRHFQRSRRHRRAAQAGGRPVGGDGRSGLGHRTFARRPRSATGRSAGVAGRQAKVCRVWPCADWRFSTAPRLRPVLLAAYSRLSEADSATPSNTLCARPQWALALLKAIDRGELPATAISVEQVRQLEGFRQCRRFGRARAGLGSGAGNNGRQARRSCKSYRSRLPADRLQSADRGHGRAIFARVCSTATRFSMPAATSVRT